MLNMMQTIATKAHTHISAPEAPSMTFFFGTAGTAPTVDLLRTSKSKRRTNSTRRAERDLCNEWFLIEYPAMKRGLHKM